MATVVDTPANPTDPANPASQPSDATEVANHWERVYLEKPPEERSWFQTQPVVSLGLMDFAGRTCDAAVIDVGGGTSHMVDELIKRGYHDVCVVDVSAAAIEQGKARLGARADTVRWIVSDIRTATLPRAAFDLWHDRAVFHFLIDEADRRAYKRNLCAALRPNGHVILATFAEDGPERCSGLPVRRYSAAGLAEELGPEFTLITSERESHHTPGGREQRFVYALLRRNG